MYLLKRLVTVINLPVEPNMCIDLKPRGKTISNKLLAEIALCSSCYHSKIETFVNENYHKVSSLQSDIPETLDFICSVKDCDCLGTYRVWESIVRKEAEEKL